MSISSITGGQSAAQVSRPAFKPPSFESLDANSDSALTLDELKLNAPKGASKSAANERAEALFKAMDADEDGSVTSAEKDAFDTQMADQRQAMAFMTQQIAGPSSADIFAQTDTDGDGAVTLSEFGAEDGAAEIGSDALQKLFDLIDADGDGSVTEAESTQFLDTLQSALGEGQQAGGPPPGPPPEGPPPAASDDSDTGTVPTLYSAAQNAYKTSQQQTLLEQLSAIFDSAA